MRPPPLRALTFLAYSLRIYSSSPVLDFVLSCRLIHLIQPYMRFLSVGPRFCLQLPSDPASRQRPCSWLAIMDSCSILNCTRGGLSPPSQYPCRANIKFPHRLTREPVSLFVIVFEVHFLDVACEDIIWEFLYHLLRLLCRRFFLFGFLCLFLFLLQV